MVTIGGFNGGDPAPTAAELAQMGRDGELNVRPAGRRRRHGRPGRGTSAISEWMQAHGTAVSGAGTSSGGTLYAVSA